MRLCAAFLNKVFHQIEIAWLLRDVVQPHQRQLDFRVARIAVQLVFARAKHAVDMIRQPAHHVQQAALSGSLEIRHTRFNHMSGAVQFVALGQIGPALGRCFHVAVLKDHPVELPLFQTGRDTEVGDGVAGFSLRHAIVKRIPLVGDYHIADQPLVLTKKRVVDFQLMQVGFHYGHIVLLRTVHDAGANRWQCATSRDC